MSKENDFSFWDSRKTENSRNADISTSDSSEDDDETKMKMDPLAGTTICAFLTSIFLLNWCSKFWKEKTTYGADAKSVDSHVVGKFEQQVTGYVTSSW